MKIYEIVEVIRLDDLKAKMAAQQKKRMLDSVLNYLEKPIKADPARELMLFNLVEKLN